MNTYPMQMRQYNEAKTVVFTKSCIVESSGKISRRAPFSKGRTFYFPFEKGDGG
jgi:hypothetical protein